MSTPSGTLEGRTCLVTGATSGIGLETAVGLAERGARVALVGRSAERGERAREEVARRSGNDAVELLLADLSSQAEIRTLAREVLDRYDALHVLVNNAGIVNVRRELTVDGLEATFAVNHLAYFLLTTLLLDRLVASAPARIVSVASEAHRFADVDFDDLQSEHRYASLPVIGGMRVYGASKSANILFTVELARRLEGTGVTANCVHPGAVASSLGKNNGALGRLITAALSPFMRTPAQGAATSIHVASAPGLAHVSGRYFVDEKQARPRGAACDPAAARRLWEESEKLTAASAGVAP